jgi:hypothetical protein
LADARLLVTGVNGATGHAEVEVGVESAALRFRFGYTLMFSREDQLAAIFDLPVPLVIGTRMLADLAGVEDLTSLEATEATRGSGGQKR